MRLMMLLDRIHVNYELGLDTLKLVSTNIDFAQLKLIGGLIAGPQGRLKISIHDILAQAPVCLDFKISKEKNIGQQPLVPYIINFKTEDNGDISLQVIPFVIWWYFHILLFYFH